MEVMFHQSFVNRAKLLNTKIPEIDCLDGQSSLAAFGGWIEHQAAENVCEGSVRKAPLFKIGMSIRIKKAAVVLRDFVLNVFLFLGAINQMAKLSNVLVKSRS